MELTLLKHFYLGLSGNHQLDQSDSAERINEKQDELEGLGGWAGREWDWKPILRTGFGPTHSHDIYPRALGITIHHRNKVMKTRLDPFQACPSCPKDLGPEIMEGYERVWFGSGVSVEKVRPLPWRANRANTFS